MNITIEYNYYLNHLNEALAKLDIEKINKLYQIINKRLGSKQTIFICGNGGSASTASHMSLDLSKTILGKGTRNSDKNLRVISLNESIPLLTAWSNDKGYKYIFSEQLENLGNNGDLLIIISASGNSSNILEAIKTASRIGIETFGLIGFDGGSAKEKLDEFLLVESFDYGIVEDIHLILNHSITKCLKTFISRE